MEQYEIEPLVSELESRVDRLRSLYDQYFMGIERLEPLVPRKDVELRLAILRKEQIRNTGVRFRFHMIIQRFNTYVTHWQRITRQIETGTYKRHVARATARFGVDPTKERAVEVEPGERRASEAPDDGAPVAIPERPAEEVYELDAHPDEEPFNLEDDPFGGLIPVLDDEVPELKAPAAPHRPAVRVQAQAPLPRERFASSVSFDDIADPFEENDPFPKPAQKNPSAPMVRLTRAPEPPPAAPQFDTDRRIPIAAPARPMISKRPPAPPASPPPVAPQTAPSEPRVPAPRIVPMAPGSAPRVQVAATGRTIAPSPRAAPSMLPNAPAGSRVVPPGPTVVAPSAAMPAAAAIARPGASSSIPAPAARADPIVSRPPPPPQRVGDLSGDRFGEIYAKYVETRRQHNEPTGAITRDALAKQLADSTDRLKQKHGAKAIDFEVVVKDGRTILRPVVK